MCIIIIIIVLYGRPSGVALHGSAAAQSRIKHYALLTITYICMYNDARVSVAHHKHKPLRHIQMSMCFLNTFCAAYN